MTLSQLPRAHKSTLCKEPHSVRGSTRKILHCRDGVKNLCEKDAARCVVGHDCQLAATMPSSRLPHPILGITTPSLCWGPRPIPALRIQRYQSNDPRRGYRTPTDQRPKREDLLKWSRFPRHGADMTTFYKIVSAIKHIPQLLNTLIFHGKEYLLGRMPVPPASEGVKIMSRPGRFVYCFFSQPLVMISINKTIEPWGGLSTGSGGSMLPSLPASPGIDYSSYVYFDKHDIKIGDIVLIVGPNYDVDGVLICKRVAALEGDQVWVRKTHGVRQKRFRVRLSYVINLPSGVFVDH